MVSVVGCRPERDRQVTVNPSRRLRERRVELQMSIQELAVLTGIAEASLVGFEENQVVASTGELTLLAAALEVSVVSFFEERVDRL